jgi:hypothetical protein
MVATLFTNEILWEKLAQEKCELLTQSFISSKMIMPCIVFVFLHVFLVFSHSYELVFYGKGEIKIVEKKSFISSNELVIVSTF